MSALNPGDPDPEIGRLHSLFPPLERAERLSLIEELAERSRWSINFGVMLGCSVLIAGLGLLQNSVAIIIGAMLVAPLMTPLIGTGLAVAQGNFLLLGEALRTMLIACLVSLALGVALRLVTPGHELTAEVSLRGAPNILDLAIAFLAGIAAGYAIARPKLSGALPGVAISVALVPPLAAAGIALGSTDWTIAFGALLLFATNLVAIVLGSALVFRLHGITVSDAQRTRSTQTKRILIGLVLALVILMAPLAYRFADQLRLGQARPESLTLSESMWYQLHDRLDREEGIDFLTGVRASSERPEDVVLVITADRPVPESLVIELDEIIDEGMGTDVKVKFSVLRQGELVPQPSDEESPEELPEVNQ